MTKDEIMKWARESGGLPDPMVFIGAYERFANLVAAAEREAMNKRIRTVVVQAEERGAAAEREAIAKLADESVNADKYPTLTMLAAAIRMRGDK